MPQPGLTFENEWNRLALQRPRQLILIFMFSKQSSPHFLSNGGRKLQLMHHTDGQLHLVDVCLILVTKVLQRGQDRGWRHLAQAAQGGLFYIGLAALSPARSGFPGSPSPLVILVRMSSICRMPKGGQEVHLPARFVGEEFHGGSCKVSMTQVSSSKNIRLPTPQDQRPLPRRALNVEMSVKQVRL